MGVNGCLPTYFILNAGISLFLRSPAPAGREVGLEPMTDTQLLLEILTVYSLLLFGRAGQIPLVSSPWQPPSHP